MALTQSDDLDLEAFLATTASFGAAVALEDERRWVPRAGAENRSPRIRLSLDRSIEAVNPAMEELVGYREGELTGCSVLSLAHPEEMEALLLRLDAFGRGAGECSGATYRCLDRVGRTLWLAVTATLARGADGGPQSIDVDVDDITAWVSRRGERPRNRAAKRPSWPPRLGRRSSSFSTVKS
jgi:PAS domain S-box-containing protein